MFPGLQVNWRNFAESKAGLGRKRTGGGFVDSGYWNRFPRGVGGGGGGGGRGLF